MLVLVLVLWLVVVLVVVLVLWFWCWCKVGTQGFGTEKIKEMGIEGGYGRRKVFFFIFTLILTRERMFLSY